MRESMQATTATARAGRTGLLPGEPLRPLLVRLEHPVDLRCHANPSVHGPARAGTIASGQDGRVRTVEEHQAVVTALIAPLAEETVPLAAAHGRVLARDVTAAVALPSFDNSAMDGYAARWSEVGGAAEAPVRLPVAEDIPAGRTDVVPLAPGTVHRIMTGAPLPPGADVVIPVELTDAGTEIVEIRDAPAAGTHLRAAGEDIAEGSVALTAGTPLGAAQLGLAAAVGLEELPVRRRPRVLVLSTGSELVAPGQPLLPGQIYESNSALLVAAVEDAGGEARRLHFVPDDVDQFLATVRSELQGADLLITSGGVSAGAFEVVKDAFGTLGTVEFAKVAMQPGGPQGAGTVDGVPVVTLPGNPVSSFVSFEVFVRPALRRALGHASPDRLHVPARLTDPLRSPEGKRQFLRGRYGGGLVSQVGGPGLAPGRAPRPRQLPGRRPRGRHRTARRRRGRRRADRGSAPVTEPRLTHVDETGAARMVDVSEKAVTTRVATAAGRVLVSPEVVALLRGTGVPKGDAVAVARIAGIAGAKRTPDLVPLCHPIALHGVTVDLEVTDEAVEITATARTADRTGVEMEALTSVAVAGLTMIDMVKAVDPRASITDVRLLAKSGGKSGEWRR